MEGTESEHVFWTYIVLAKHVPCNLSFWNPGREEKGWWVEII